MRSANVNRITTTADKIKLSRNLPTIALLMCDVHHTFSLMKGGIPCQQFYVDEGELFVDKTAINILRRHIKPYCELRPGFRTSYSFPKAIFSCHEDHLVDLGGEESSI